MMNSKKIKMDKSEEIEFEDGSKLEIPDVWIECIKIKHGLSLEEYWIQIRDMINKLWEEGEVLTKFGVLPLQEYYEEWEREENQRLTRAWHARECIYTDLRACIMVKALEMLGKKEGKKPCVIAIGENKVTVYEGCIKKKKEYCNIDKAMKEKE